MKETPRDSPTPGLGAARRLPAVAPRKSGGVARHRAEARPQPREPTGTARGAFLPGTKVGLAPRRRAQPGVPQGTLAVRRVWEGARAPPPLPRRAPGNLLIKIAKAPPLRVRPLPPSPGGGRASRPYRLVNAAKATALRAAALKTPDKESRNSRSPPPRSLQSPPPPHRQPPPSPPSPATPPPGRARPAPPRLTRDRARAPGTLAQRARLSQAVPGAARPRPGERLERIVQS